LKADKSMKINIKIKNEAILAYLQTETATLCPIPGLYETLELGKTVLSPVNQLTPVCLQNLVNVKKSEYSFRYNNIVDIPQVKTTTYGKKKLKLLRMKV
jgi:hypothetical protein